MSRFSWQDISVDDKFARFGSKSFAINKITSVDVRSTFMPGGKGYIAFWLVTLLSFVFSFVDAEARVGMLILSVACALFGWLSYKRSVPITIYRLFLVTSGAEAQAYETTDGTVIVDLRNALETAISESQ